MQIMTSLKPILQRLPLTMQEPAGYVLQSYPKLNDIVFFFSLPACTYIKDPPDSRPAVAMEEKDADELGQMVVLNTNEPRSRQLTNMFNASLLNY